MRVLVAYAAILLFASPLAGKTIGSFSDANDIATARQGGDTLEAAFRITALPFSDSGTTNGYGQDYDGFCAYPESGMAADVCYVYIPAADDMVTIDLLGSDYDTTLLVFQVVGADLQPLECNDDFYPDLTSRIEDLSVTTGSMYLIVVDGYGFNTGNYVLAVTGGVVGTDSKSWSEMKDLYR